MKTIKTLTIIVLLLFVGSAYAQDDKKTDKKTFEISFTKNGKKENDKKHNVFELSVTEKGETTLSKSKDSGTLNFMDSFEDTSKKKWKNNRWSWYKGHYMGVNIHYNGLTGAANSPFTNLDTKSIGVDINLIDVVIFSHRRFGIVTGLGIESNNFRFLNSVSIKVDENNFAVPDYQYRDAGIQLQKSKLTTTYLNVPLLFQFNLGRSEISNGSGWFSFGVVAGLRLQSYTKIKMPDGQKIKNFDNFNLRNIHWGAMASFGYNALTFTAKYYPQSIFRDEQGPHNEQFNFGFGLTF